MKNKGTQRDTAFAIILILAGIILSIMTAVKFGFSLFMNTEFAPILLISGTSFGFFCFYLSFKSFARVTRFTKLKSKMGNAKRFRIPALAVAVRKTEEFVFTDLNRMINLGYFPNGEIDLESKELITDKNSEPLDIPFDELKTMYKKHTKFPAMPFISAALAFIFFSVFDYGSYAGVITGGAMGVFTMIVTFCFFPAPVYFTVVNRPAPKPKPVPKTGNEELDAFLSSAGEYEADLHRINSGVRGSPFGKTIEELVRLLGEISTHIAEHPEKLRQLRQFSTYYLPTTVRLAESYEELWSVPDKGINITQSISKIENMGGKIVGVFKNEHDLLFGDKAMDISAEISVMESMISESKAEISPFGKGE